MTAGQEIAKIRESLGWTRRELASRYGTSTRRIRAIETDSDPKPRKEDPRHCQVFIPYLGYQVHHFYRGPVTDRNFDLKQQQTRILGWLTATEGF